MINRIQMNKNIEDLYDKFILYSNLNPCHTPNPLDLTCCDLWLFHDLGIELDQDELALNQLYFDSKVQSIFDYKGLHFESYYNKINSETYCLEPHRLNTLSHYPNKKLYMSGSFKLWCELVFSLLSLSKKHVYGLIQCKHKIFSPFVCMINALYDTCFINRNYKRIKDLVTKIDACEKFIEIDYKRHRRELLKEKIMNICKEEI